MINLVQKIVISTGNQIVGSAIDAVKLLISLIIFVSRFYIIIDFSFKLRMSSPLHVLVFITVFSYVEVFFIF